MRLLMLLLKLFLLFLILLATLGVIGLGIGFVYLETPNSWREQIEQFVEEPLQTLESITAEVRSQFSGQEAPPEPVPPKAAGRIDRDTGSGLEALPEPVPPKAAPPPPPPKPQEPPKVAPKPAAPTTPKPAAPKSKLPQPPAEIVKQLKAIFPGMTDQEVREAYRRNQLMQQTQSE